MGKRGKGPGRRGTRWLTEGGARAHHNKKVLYVCTANIRSSLMAEALFNFLDLFDYPYSNVVSLSSGLRYLNEKSWVVERSFGWAARFRRLVKDYERLLATVAGLHFVAFACRFLHRAIAVLGSSP